MSGPRALRALAAAALLIAACGHDTGRDVDRVHAVTASLGLERAGSIPWRVDATTADFGAGASTQLEVVGADANRTVPQLLTSAGFTPTGTGSWSHGSGRDYVQVITTPLAPGQSFADLKGDRHRAPGAGVLVTVTSGV